MQRPGYYHLGIPLSGAMDRLALCAANLLVGNDEGAAGLECVFWARSSSSPRAPRWQAGRDVEARLARVRTAISG